MTTLPSNPETAAFRDACRDHRLLVRKCTACGKVHWYPRTLCPICFSDKTVWQDSPGTGVIYSYSVMRRVATPYAIAYVTLDEGVSLMTNIVEADLDGLRIGQRVKVAFREQPDGSAVPVFRPAV
ncbi:Zn-ribbon domain-containing OB-fold protein [Ferrovibrio xuzhouensis]|uniref:Zn-ribbon domain-containing OB-fold protein n=1 Tax=Ferrovibrio xuzhouensis TaxID=1576914 RepID=A0ABV7VNH0_9PROT